MSRKMIKDIYLSGKDSIKFLRWSGFEANTLENNFLYAFLFFNEIKVLGNHNEMIGDRNLIKTSQFNVVNSLENEEIFNLCLMYKQYGNIDEDNEDIEYFYYDLAILTYCTVYQGSYLFSTELKNRNSIISEICELIPPVEKTRKNAIDILKKSFIEKDIADLILFDSLPNPSLLRKILIKDEIFKELSLLKESEEFSFLIKLHEELVEQYKGGYFINESAKSNIKIRLNEASKTLFKNMIDLDSIDSFKFTELLSDQVSAYVGLMIPIFPISTIIEVKRVLKNKKYITDDVKAILAIIHLKSLISDRIIKDSEYNDDCFFCNITNMEIEELSEDECHDVFLGEKRPFCEGHLLLSLQIRKFYKLTGRKLLYAIVNS